MVGVTLELAAHLAGEHDAVGGDERLAGDACFRIAADEQVDDGIGDLVGDLVRMAFGHRFGGEEVVAAHSKKPFWACETAEREDSNIGHKDIFMCDLRGT